MTGDKSRSVPEADSKQPQTTATTEYCAKLQHWMWQYYWGYTNWQSWLSLSAFPYKLPCASPLTPGEPASVTGGGQHVFDVRSWYNYPYPFSNPASSPPPPAGGEQRSDRTDARLTQQQNGNPAQAGREYTIPSPLQRFLAETVDFFILFCVKATIVLWIMHLSGMKDITKFITHFIVEEIDENTSIEDLQKMMAVALVYRVLVCFYEKIPSVSSHLQEKPIPHIMTLFNEGSHGSMSFYITIPVPIEGNDATLYSSLPEMKSRIASVVGCLSVALWSQTICIWGAGGATPGKFLLGLRVVTCDTSTLVRPNRVLVVPASHVSLSASTVRALNKNFSIAFLFPVFITLLFFQHNRTVYDIVAGTIVVQRRGAR